MKDTPYIDIHCHCRDTGIITDTCTGIDAQAESLGYVLRVGSLRLGVNDDIRHDTLHPQAAPDNTYNLGCFAAGIHPWDAAECLDVRGLFRPLTTSAVGASGCFIAVGEIGLDFRDNMPPRDTQIIIFKSQIEIAQELNIPLVVHSVEAQQATMSMLEGCSRPWVWHAFSRSGESARQILANSNAYLSFGASLLTNTKIQQTLASISSVDRIFFETDTRQIHISHIYSAAAEILGLSVQDLKTIINQNFEIWSGRNVQNFY